MKIKFSDMLDTLREIYPKMSWIEVKTNDSAITTVFRGECRGDGDEDSAIKAWVSLRGIEMGAYIGDECDSMPVPPELMRAYLAILDKHIDSGA